MKKYKILFWTSTGLISAMMLFSAFSYITNPQIEAGFQHLGFPDYFRVELAIAKSLGAVLLLVPFNFWLKEWVYGGFFITFVSAFIAHFSSHDPINAMIMPIIALTLLLLSYFYYKKLQIKPLRI